MKDFKHEDGCVRFEVLTAVSMKIAVFWVVAPYSLVEVYQRFNATTQNTTNFVLKAVRTSNTT
jgi:Co/Zn/Cd efflux system component